jgi:hypothetical protein
MRAPKTTTIFVLAVVLLVIGGAAESGYYPAAKPVLGPDGASVLGADGRALVHRDMGKFYRLNAPAFALMGCSACLFGWWLIRVSRHVYGWFLEGRKQS